MKTEKAKAKKLSNARVAILGAGKTGPILMQAMLQKGVLSKTLIHAPVQHAEKADTLNNELGIEVGTDNAAAARDSQIILVCVKPQTVAQVMEEIAPVMTPNKLVISVAASVPTDYMEK